MEPKRRLGSIAVYFSMSPILQVENTEEVSNKKYMLRILLKQLTAWRYLFTPQANDI